MSFSDREKAIFLVGYHLHNGSFSKSARDASLTVLTTYAGASITDLAQEAQATFKDAESFPADQSVFTPAALPVENWS